MAVASLVCEAGRCPGSEGSSRGRWRGGVGGRGRAGASVLVLRPEGGWIELGTGCLGRGGLGQTTLWFLASKDGQGGPADWESQASSLRAQSGEQERVLFACLLSELLQGWS